MRIMKIPAASIHDVDLAQVRLRFPDAADEIARLGELMAHGKESPEEFIVLTRLLHDVGQLQKAEELLRCNVVEEGDLVHREYIARFGNQASEKFERAILEFADQFGVVLSQPSARRFLRVTYSSSPQPGQTISDSRILRFLCSTSEIEFRYESEGTTADITSDLPELYDEYLLLRQTKSGWKGSETGTHLVYEHTP
jgi:hypothetical protein